RAAAARQGCGSRSSARGGQSASARTRNRPLTAWRRAGIVRLDFRRDDHADSTGFPGKLGPARGRPRAPSRPRARGGRAPRDGRHPGRGRLFRRRGHRPGAHPELYRETSIAPEKAPDHPGYDVLGDVVSKAHARGMKVFAWFEDVFRPDVPGIGPAVENDAHGRPGPLLCFRNPNTRRFWLALVEDFLGHYELDGLMWG